MGVPLDLFKKRQRMFYEAERRTMLDVPEFIEKAHHIYGYTNFINDAGGSLCEIDDDYVFETLAENTLILYIEATEQNKRDVIERARSKPKPLYYRESFLDEYLEKYLQENNMQYAAQIDPDEFSRWVFPHLFYARIPRYEAIAKKYGYSVSSERVAQVKTEEDFLTLVKEVIAQAE